MLFSDEPNLMFLLSTIAIKLIKFFSPSRCLTELYQQVLAKALAHYFEAKLLLLDLTDFSLKVTMKSFAVI